MSAEAYKKLGKKGLPGVEMKGGARFMPTDKATLERLAKKTGIKSLAELKNKATTTKFADGTNPGIETGIIPLSDDDLEEVK